MVKIFIEASLFLVFIFSFLCAETNLESNKQNPDKSRRDAENILRFGTFMYSYKEMNKLRSYSDQLSTDERNRLYFENQKGNNHVCGGCGLNFLLPGVGSLIIGDYTDALIVGIGYWGCFGATVFLNNKAGNTPWPLLTGLGAAAFWIYGLVTPLIYVSVWNYNLKVGLRLYPDVNRSQWDERSVMNKSFGLKAETMLVLAEF